MKVFGYVLVVGLWLGAGLYLLLNSHPFAGGFCIFVGSCIGYKEGQNKGEIK